MTVATQFFCQNRNFSRKLQVFSFFFISPFQLFLFPLVSFSRALQGSVGSRDGSVVLPELRRDLLDGLVLRFRNLEPDVDDEEDLGHDEDDEDVGAENQLKKEAMVRFRF